MKTASLAKNTTGWQEQVLVLYLRNLLSQTYGQSDASFVEQTEPDSVTLPQLGQSSPSALPHWVQPEFEVVYFRIGHMVLAAPLSEVKRIERLDDSIRVTVLPGKPGWFQGLTRCQGETIQLADTALLIGGKRPIADNSRRHALLLNEGRWGLVCGEIIDMGRLHRSDVRWREKRSRRAWAAGTIIDRLCVLVDPHSLIPAGRGKDMKFYEKKARG
jgi:purine-binding chemotaxis protein CheW